MDAGRQARFILGRVYSSTGPDPRIRQPITSDESWQDWLEVTTGHGNPYLDIYVIVSRQPGANDSPPALGETWLNAG